MNSPAPPALLTTLPGQSPHCEHWGGSEQPLDPLALLRAAGWGRHWGMRERARTATVLGMGQLARFTPLCFQLWLGGSSARPVQEAAPSRSSVL